MGNLLMVIFFSLGQVQLHGVAKKQTITSLSSCEAEYRAEKEARKESIWIQNLLFELGFAQSSATPLYCDNQNAIQVANNPFIHAKTKHIEIDVHYIWDLVQENFVNLQFCPSED